MADRTHKQAAPVMARKLFEFGFDAPIPEARLDGYGERPDVWALARVTRKEAFVDDNGELVTVYAGNTAVGEYKRFKTDAENDQYKDWRKPTYYAFGDYRFLFIAGELELYHIEEMPWFERWGVVEFDTGKVLRRPLRFARVAHDREKLLVLSYADWLRTGWEPSDEAGATHPRLADPDAPKPLEGWLARAVTEIEDNPGKLRAVDIKRDFKRPESAGKIVSMLKGTYRVEQDPQTLTWSPVAKESQNAA